MGGRGNSGSRNNSSAPVEFKYAEPVLEPLKPTKYAKEIFDHNYREARQLVDRFGESQPFEMSNLYWTDDNPAMSKQALRGVQALINRERENIDLDVELGVFTQEKAQKHRAALNAVQKTLNKQYKSIYGD